MIREDAESYFLRHVRPQPDGCWKWYGRLRWDNGGKIAYGQMSWRGRSHGAHRVAHELYVGPIPQGLQIDHLCRNTRCVNPAHLEAVTQRENVLRGVGFAAVNARKTHCIRGHEFTPENTIIQCGGKRACRTCVYEAHRLAYHRRKAEAAS